MILDQDSLTEKKTLPRIFVYEMHQDDPSKCTSAKMRRFGIARGISKQHIPRNAVVLNPYGELPVMMTDRQDTEQYGLVVIDCSWNLADSAFNSHFNGKQRRLPALLAGNPTNYAKLGCLSSIEAVAAALYIVDFKPLSEKILSIYKWGPTFLSLNHDALEDYSRALSVEAIKDLEHAYFPSLGMRRE